MSPAQQHAFEQFWRAYPRKVAKLAAAREWERRQPDLDTVLTALRLQIPTWTDPQFIPHPRTWLHQGRYLDEWEFDAMLMAHGEPRASGARAELQAFAAD